MSPLIIGLTIPIIIILGIDIALNTNAALNGLQMLSFLNISVSS